MPPEDLIHSSWWCTAIIQHCCVCFSPAPLPTTEDIYVYIQQQAQPYIQYIYIHIHESWSGKLSRQSKTKITLSSSSFVLWWSKVEKNWTSCYQKKTQCSSIFFSRSFLTSAAWADCWGWCWRWQSGAKAWGFYGSVIGLFCLGMGCKGILPWWL